MNYDSLIATTQLVPVSFIIFLNLDNYYLKGFNTVVNKQHK
jgi:hypothetical protein